MLSLRGRDGNGNTVLFSSHDIQDNVVVFINGEFLLIDPATIEAVEDSPSDTAWKPEVCPLTSAPFFMWIGHPEFGWVPTYGGPFESYTIPARNDAGEYEREVYDHDADSWNEGPEVLNDPRKALLGEIRTAVSNIRTFQRNFDGTEYTTPCCMIWQITKILDELEAKP